MVTRKPGKKSTKPGPTKVSPSTQSKKKTVITGYIAKEKAAAAHLSELEAAAEAHTPSVTVSREDILEQNLGELDTTEKTHSKAKAEKRGRGEQVLLQIEAEQVARQARIGSSTRIRDEMEAGINDAKDSNCTIIKMFDAEETDLEIEVNSARQALRMLEEAKVDSPTIERAYIAKLKATAASVEPPPVSDTVVTPAPDGGGSSPLPMPFSSEAARSPDPTAWLEDAANATPTLTPTLSPEPSAGVVAPIPFVVPNGGVTGDVTAESPTAGSTGEDALDSPPLIPPSPSPSPSPSPLDGGLSADNFVADAEAANDAAAIELAAAEAEATERAAEAIVAEAAAAEVAAAEAATAEAAAAVERAAVEVAAAAEAATEAAAAKAAAEASAADEAAAAKAAAEASAAAEAAAAKAAAEASAAERTAAEAAAAEAAAATAAAATAAERTAAERATAEAAVAASAEAANMADRAYDASFGDLRDFLDNIGMVDKAFTVLLDNDVEDMDTLLELTKQDLMDVGLKIGPAAKIYNAGQRSRSASPDKVFSPEPTVVPATRTPVPVPEAALPASPRPDESTTHRKLPTPPPSTDSPAEQRHNDKGPRRTSEYEATKLLEKMALLKRAGAMAVPPLVEMAHTQEPSVPVSSGGIAGEPSAPAPVVAAALLVPKAFDLSTGNRWSWSNAHGLLSSFEKAPATSYAHFIETQSSGAQKWWRQSRTAAEHWSVFKAEPSPGSVPEATAVANVTTGVITLGPNSTALVPAQIPTRPLGLEPVASASTAAGSLPKKKPKIKTVPANLLVGARVQTKRGVGTLRWYGEATFAKKHEAWCGVEMAEYQPAGGNGTIGGEAYFEVETGYALFFRPHKLTVINVDSDV